MSKTSNFSAYCLKSSSSVVVLVYRRVGGLIYGVCFFNCLFLICPSVGTLGRC